MVITINYPTAGDEKFNSLLAYLDGNDIKYSAKAALQQTHVSGALEFLEQKLNKVTKAIRQPDISDKEYHKQCQIQEQIVHAMRLISHLGANDR